MKVINKSNLYFLQYCQALYKDINTYIIFKKWGLENYPGTNITLCTPVDIFEREICLPMFIANATSIDLI